MKKNHYSYLPVLLLITLLPFLYECDDKKEQEPDVVTEINPELFFASTSPQTITFTTNKAWSVSLSSPNGNTSWCEVSPLSGNAGTVNLVVNASENTSYDDRTVVLTIKTGNTIKEVRITQQAKSNESETVQVNIPGTLINLLGNNYEKVKVLTITGRINGGDIQTIKKMPLQYLDLSDVFIVSGGYSHSLKDNTISSFMFQGMIDLHTIILPNSITSIEVSAFISTGLTSITIPNSVNSIEGGAFINCRRLTKITVSTDNNYYSDIDGVLTNKDKTELVGYPSAKSQHYAIPNSIKTIGKRAFSYCSSLTSIDIPNSVEDIKEGAFMRCLGLTSIDIPNSVRIIEGEAFLECSNLTSITIGSGAFRITSTQYGGPAGAFAHCNAIKEVHIKRTVPPYSDGGIPHKNAIKLYIPKGSKEAYQNNEYWKGFYQYIEE